jgi:rhodanese-related sulfurtransferase
LNNERPKLKLCHKEISMSATSKAKTQTDILNTAQQHGQQTGLPYQGALQPSEAGMLMQLDLGAKLIDVRTHAELDWVGRVPGAIEIEWATYPGMQPNPHFLAELQQRVADKSTVLMFLCRSGARAHHAATAAARAGYASCYNVLDGFEGDKDAQGHRNTVNGWRKANLPWQQS